MLQIRGLTYEVEEAGETKRILDELDLDIQDGKFTVITGPNGGGKSTLAKLIAGIIKPTSGSIILDGEDITEMNITDRARRGVSFAFQQPVKFKGLEVFDLLKIAAGKETKLKIDDACKYLSEVGLCAKDYINREVNGSLSGGELKRIEIATVLARGTKLSVFDEPEAGIDLWSFQNLTRIFENMRKNIKDSSIIIISHQERILKIADEIVVIANGKIKQQGTGTDVLPALTGTADAVLPCNKFTEVENG
ncbi:MAG: ATP-binding cassette domain-containing protein [Clostridiales bacterium]|nr:ATP-binding cassette domain-containing protein [Clostridiales bacterium]